MSELIYVVFGTTGEYSDRTEWLIKAFTTEEAAKELVAKATQRANELIATAPNRYSIKEGSNEFDPGMQVDYTGTSYFYEKVELDRKEV